jgi:hypothetical protein
MIDEREVYLLRLSNSGAEKNEKKLFNFILLFSSCSCRDVSGFGGILRSLVGKNTHYLMIISGFI